MSDQEKIQTLKNVIHDLCEIAGALLERTTLPCDSAEEIKHSLEGIKQRIVRLP